MKTQISLSIILCLVLESLIPYLFDAYYYIKKGTDINTINKDKTIDINDKINSKKRKMLGYLPAEQLFLNELSENGVTENTIFYKS